MLKRPLIGWSLLLLSLVSFAEGSYSASASEEDIAVRLANLIPPRPAEPTPEALRVMHEAAATQRLDVATLLIKALAFTWGLYGSNESLSPFERLPAAVELGENYGSEVLPLLFVEGIATDEEWLRERIAIATRGIGKREDVLEMEEVFSLEVSSNSGARKLHDLLSRERLEIRLVDPVLEETLRRIERLKKGEEEGLEVLEEPHGQPRRESREEAILRVERWPTGVPQFSLHCAGLSFTLCGRDQG